jgi:GNAT superfamily N-acetyltransferase
VTDPADRELADSVRLAWPAEAVTIAELQRRSWATQWPADLGERMLGSVTTEEMTQAWHRAITRPPGATSRVLVAVGGSGRVVGFATTTPSADEDAEAGVHGEIEQFVIDPPAQRRGHGSRLLNACADTLRSDGFREAWWWVGTEDDVLRRFLLAAGWATDGASREIGSDDGSLRLKQVRLHTDLGEVGP